MSLITSCTNPVGFQRTAQYERHRDLRALIWIFYRKEQCREQETNQKKCLILKKKAKSLRNL